MNSRNYHTTGTFCLLLGGEADYDEGPVILEAALS